jgi:hypothetical protein
MLRVARLAGGAASVCALALLAAFVCALALVATGCGSSKSSTSASVTTSSSTTATSASTASSRSGTGAVRYVRTTVRSGRSGPSGAIPVAALGRISYRCAGGAVTASLGGRVAATERVYVEGDRRRHVRAGTVQPPSRLAVAPVRDRALVWHIIQSTEGSTLDGIVTVRFGRGAARLAGAAACSPVRWTLFIGVISHAEPWTVPRAWL